MANKGTLECLVDVFCGGAQEQDPAPRWLLQAGWPGPPRGDVGGDVACGKLRFYLDEPECWIVGPKGRQFDIESGHCGACHGGMLRHVRVNNCWYAQVV